MSMTNYIIVMKALEDGKFLITFPDFEGLTATADSEESIQSVATETIKTKLAELKKDNLLIPEAKKMKDVSSTLNEGEFTTYIPVKENFDFKTTINNLKDKESLKKGVLEELKNNTGNDSRTTILEYQVKLTDKDIVEEITYYVRSKNEDIIKKEKEKYKNSTTYKLIEEKNDKEVQELKYKVTSNIGKTTGEIITILNGLMSNNKFNFTMSDSSQTKDNDTESDLKKLQ